MSIAQGSRTNTKVILSDIYRACNTGEIVGLLGRNGTGQSTLLKIILWPVRADNKLDEPINGLSPKLRDSICQYIKDLAPTKGFIISDHDYTNVINLSDRLVLLTDGYLREINDKTRLVDLGYLLERHV